LSVPGSLPKRSSTTSRAATRSTSSSGSSHPSGASRRSQHSSSHAPRSWLVRVLLDEHLPVDLGRALQGHHVDTVVSRGWAGVKNGDLLQRMRGEYEVLLTMDRGASCPAGAGDPRSPVSHQAGSSVPRGRIARWAWAGSRKAVGHARYARLLAVRRRAGLHADFDARISQTRPAGVTPARRTSRAWRDQ
jgi:hypothetical protein